MVTELTAVILPDRLGRADRELAPGPVTPAAEDEIVGRMDDQASERIDLHQVARLLRREWVVIVACMVLLGSAALVTALSAPKQYTAAASLLFRDPAFDQKLFGSTFLGGSRDPDREAATNVALVAMKQVATRTAARSDIGLTPREIQAAVVVSPEGRSDVVTVRATVDSPRVAAALANAFTTEFVDIRREADRRTIFNAQSLVQRQLDELRKQDKLSSPRANSLRERAEELSVLGSLQTGNAELVQRAEVPSGPSGPRPKRNAAIGLFLGLILGVGLAFLRARLDRRIRTEEALAEAFDVPILARVPMTEMAKGLPAPRSRAEEAFSTLWTNLRYFNVTSGIGSILITSPTSGDGKSTVALNLAAAAARSGSDVLLIEADLRRPSLTTALGGQQSPGGLTQVLAGLMPFEQAVLKVPATRVPAVDDPMLDILVAGPIPPNPAQLLDSHAMRELLHDVCSRYDLVVIDTPPLTVVPDSVPLLHQVSAVLAVGRLGSSSRDAASVLRSQLKIMDAPLVGVVANLTKDGGSDPYYYQDPQGLPKRDLRTPTAAVQR